MKSDIVRIDSQGNGFEEALLNTVKVAEFRGLSQKECLQLQLCTEELMSLARSVTGEIEASFWIESEGKTFQMHLSTWTVMDAQKRQTLLYAASSRKNEAAKSFLGKLRDILEEAMTADVVAPPEELPFEFWNDVSYRQVEEREWDGYEQSILRRVADNIKVAIRGGLVDLTVTKSFA